MVAKRAGWIAPAVDVAQSAARGPGSKFARSGLPDPVRSRRA
jgi:hypothetical protein